MNLDLKFQLLAIALLLMAAGLVWRHLHVWRRAKATVRDPEERIFAWRQCRRRVQSSVMLGLLPVGMLIEPWITSSIGKLVLGLVMLFLLGWLLLLVVFDYLLVHLHYRRLHRRCVADQIKFHAEINRAKASPPKDEEESTSKEED